MPVLMSGRFATIAPRLDTLLRTKMAIKIVKVLEIIKIVILMNIIFTMEIMKNMVRTSI